MILSASEGGGKRDKKGGDVHHITPLLQGDDRSFAQAVVAVPRS